MANWDILGTGGDIEDRRGVGGGALFAGGGGIVALLLALGLNFIGLDVSPTVVQDVVQSIQSLQSTQVKPEDQPVEFRGIDSYEKFASTVLGSTNDMWSAVFRDNNRTYQPPRLVLFRGVTQSACGVASSQIGPHFCPIDNTIYLDETFFDELHSRFGASKSEVAQSYVIAHEVGHSVQHQLGVFDSVGTSGQMSARDSIAVELQADCYAGVWANSVAKLGVFTAPEINDALSAAAAVGDDRIQQSTSGRVDRESWTHGSSEQRVNAFTRGYETGQPGQCVNLM